MSKQEGKCFYHRDKIKYEEPRKKMGVLDKTTNPDCVFTYKCRYCGATFKDEITSEALATKTLIRICSNTSFVVGGVNEKNIHYAEDHIGLADMIGCKKEGSED